jgi:hypothetical protein
MLPPAIAKLADTLAGMPGAVAVVLGGSRAVGTASAQSDWDLGVYYRGRLDTGVLARFGTVHLPGSWGRVMNGGAWLQIEGAKVDVLLRDLDVVEQWTARAQEGDFEIDALLGYVAGVPTYSLMAERAVAWLLHGTLPEVGAYPPRLAQKAPERWRFCSDFTLTYARMQAGKGDRVGTAGQAAKAVLEAAHARICASRTWNLNEKGLVDRAGLSRIQASFAAIPGEPGALVTWIDRLRSDLDRES